jgi:Skp family chaperone for outer membrane proteins
MTRRSALLAAAALAALAASLAAGRAASRPAAPPAAVIAVVDLERALKGLDEKAAKEAEFTARKTELERRVGDLEKRIKEKDSALKLLPVGERKPAMDELQRLAFEWKFENEYSRRVLDELEGDMIRELYQRLDAAAEALARRNGYTIVLASDEKVEVRPGRSDDVQRTISLKRMLYVAPQHDITDELITVMNNEFATQKNAPASSAAKDPKPAPAKPKN